MCSAQSVGVVVRRLTHERIPAEINARVLINKANVTAQQGGTGSPSHLDTPLRPIVLH
jgi:hypothetical protein